jgi:hypothetical protein
LWRAGTWCEAYWKVSLLFVQSADTPSEASGKSKYKHHREKLILIIVYISGKKRGLHGVPNLLLKYGSYYI